MQTNPKQKVLDQSVEVYSRWQSLLASLNEQQLTNRSLPSDLSIKDVIAHLWAWQQLSIARLEAALHDQKLEFSLFPIEGDPDSEDNLPRINAWIHETYLDAPWQQVYQKWQAGFLRFLELGKAIPEADLLEVGRYHWLEDYPLIAVLHGSCEHHTEHLDPIPGWLHLL